jgi:transcription antitermination factor NusG
MPDADSTNEEAPRWYFMRDLKRPNAKERAYQMLEKAGFEVFTPMKSEVSVVCGKRVCRQVPYINDILFVHSCKADLDRIVAKTPTLQYRYVVGGKYQEAMTIRDKDMEKFIAAVKSSDEPKYYLPQEITPAMRGRKIRIITGPMAGYEGNLLAVTGAKKKRIIVEIPSCLAVAIEVSPDNIEVVKE